MAITVNVGQFPSAAGVTPVQVEDGASVAQALTAKGLTADGFDIRLNGQPTTADAVLHEGDSVILVKKIKGNDAREIMEQATTVRRHTGLSLEQAFTVVSKKRSYSRTRNAANNAAEALLARIG
jgi:sulfur carrier protein ThiS